MRILYNGWSLIYQPNGPEALHLMALLALRPAEVQVHVALPGAPPAWLPEGALSLVRPTPGTPRARLRWEQALLPRLAGQIGADLLHSVSASAPLFERLPCVISPTGPWQGPGVPDLQGEASASGEFTGNAEGNDFIERLRRALAQGGLARARALLWPADLPPPEGSLAPVSLHRLPPAVHPGFIPPRMFAAEDLSALDLPDTYVLYHGPRGLPAIQRLLNAWSWAASAVGEAFPLVLVGFEDADRARLQGPAAQLSLEKTIRTLPPVPFPWLAEIYRGCAALFHPSPISPWGSPVRHALACERPVVAAETPLAGALSGPAAYLASADSSRTLGAALITVLVEEEVSNRLSQAAHRQRASWQGEAFSEALGSVYRSIISLS